MPAPGQEPEIDSLSHLEERIQKAVALVNRLRQEKDAALKELSATQAAFAESQSANAHLAAEVEALRTERHQVRNRIEKLLGHIDQLGAA
ncbi:MAG TPA: cell division protein ZapB [Bryobacteraceae bacterium]|jgi:FtsZ-binding cell division protein ZapB|nr:cell division protein ZapB [Bryobacteraceae bacterium]